MHAAFSNLMRWTVGSGGWQTQPLPARVVRRGLWLGLLASHLPAAVTATEAVLAGSFDLFRLAGLLGSLAFFALKLIDVPWLRFRTDARSLVAITLSVALIHAGPLGLSPNDQLAPQLLAVLTGSMFVEPVQRQWDRVQKLLHRRQAAWRTKPTLPVLSRYVADELAGLAPRWSFGLAACPPRAPPV